MGITNHGSARPTPQVKTATTPPRKAYTRPVVIDWGAVEEITGGSAFAPGDDVTSGSSPNL